MAKYLTNADVKHIKKPLTEQQQIDRSTWKVCALYVLCAILVTLGSN